VAAFRRGIITSAAESSAAEDLSYEIKTSLFKGQDLQTII